MFTGIIETQATVEHIEKSQPGITRIVFCSSISGELKVDQSVAHDGVCLTVIDCDNASHAVEVIEETIRRSKFGELQVGNTLNLERAMITGARLDGHMVQGHVDTKGVLKSMIDNRFIISHPTEFDPLVVMKGSICINGVSLTVSHTGEGELGVDLIPYTLEETNFGTLVIGDSVNLEFDILGKYVQKNLAHRSND